MTSSACCKWKKIEMNYLPCLGLKKKLEWFSPGTPISSTNKTYPLDITDILLKVVLNTIKQTIRND
jgi:hypothetical protein